MAVLALWYGTAWTVSEGVPRWRRARYRRHAARLTAELGLVPGPGGLCVGVVDGVDVALGFQPASLGNAKLFVGSERHETRAALPRVSTRLAGVAPDLPREAMPDAIALMGHAVRPALAEALRGGARLSGDRLVVEIPPSLHRVAHLRRWIATLAPAAKAIAALPPTTAGRLLSHARDDPYPAFRLRCLQLLGRFFPDADETRAAAEHGLTSPDSHARFESARIIGEPRASAALNDLLTAPGVFEAVRAKALDALTTRCRPVQLAQLEQLARSTPVVQAAIARHLGAVGEPAGQALLLTLLDAEDDDVDVAAAHALARCGGPLAIEPLLAHTTGLFAEREVKAAAAAAVAAIRARLTGDAGQLSLVDAEVGAVSLAGPDAEAVSALSEAPG